MLLDNVTKQFKDWLYTVGTTFTTIGDGDTLSGGRIIDCRSLKSISVDIVGRYSNGDATNYITVLLQESDTNVLDDFTEVAATDIINPLGPSINPTGVDNRFILFPNGQETSVIKLGYIGIKRYLRVLFAAVGDNCTDGSLYVQGVVELNNAFETNADTFEEIFVADPND